MAIKASLLFLMLTVGPATVFSIPMPEPTRTLQTRSSESGFDAGIDDGPYLTSHSSEEDDGSTSDNLNAGIPDGPHVNLYDTYTPPPPETTQYAPPEPTWTPEPIPAPSPEPTPVSPPPPPPVEPLPEPEEEPQPEPEPEPEEPEEEEIGECPAPEPEEVPEPEPKPECPCEERFNSLEEKLAQISTQLDALRQVQVDVKANQ
ncbi:hypothetical protein SI65_09118 [Aspergillus cristatus]|uniref:Uncharacterized protein n=1 Tax=Aspergillus cristatus TaxID=573508 RepID=A0A1E3B3H7_ASPCR|nr:hypothetical protein SI65_09118 [Aspergillus cristatus]